MPLRLVEVEGWDLLKGQAVNCARVKRVVDYDGRIHTPSWSIPMGYLRRWEKTPLVSTVLQVKNGEDHEL